jgi:hypothetical protein
VTLRLLSHIILNEANPVPSHLATRFRDYFSPGVITVAPATKSRCRQVWGARRVGGSEGAMPSRSRRVRQACARDHFTSAFISSLHGKEVGYSNPLTCLRSRVRVVIQTATASAQSPSYERKNAAGALRGQGDVRTRLSSITLCTTLVISPSAGPPVREV